MDAITPRNAMDSPELRATALLADLLGAGADAKGLVAAASRWVSLPVAEIVDLYSHALGGAMYLINEIGAQDPKIAAYISDYRAGLVLMSLQIDLEGGSHVG